jgi:hypothetical protein
MSVGWYPYTQAWRNKIPRVYKEPVFEVMDRFFSRSATSLLRYLSLRPQSISHVLFSGPDDYDWTTPPLTLCLNERDAPDWLKARCAARTYPLEEIGVTTIEGDREGAAFLESMGIDRWVETSDDVSGDYMYRCKMRLRVAPVDRDIIRATEINDRE